MKFIACLQITCWQKVFSLSAHITHCQFFQWLTSKLQIPQWWFLDKLSYSSWCATFLPVISIIDVINYLLPSLLAPFAECIQQGNANTVSAREQLPLRLPTILAQRSWGGWQEGKLEIKASPWRSLFPPGARQECLPGPGAEHSLKYEESRVRLRPAEPRVTHWLYSPSLGF